MQELDYVKLGQAIREVYVNIDNYQLNKDVPTFELNGKYVGDFFNFTMFEADGDNPPTFYHVYSPYDIITNASTQQAAVLRSGKLIMTCDFTQYMQQRTSVMSSLVLNGLNVGNIADKKVLYVGTGMLARRDLQALSAYYKDLTEVYFVNTSGIAEEFTSLASDLGVTAIASNLESLADFDIIICHTSAKKPVLTANMRSRIKQGAIITAFSSEDFTEVAPEFFDSAVANVIIDWPQTIDEAPELKASIESGQAKREDIIDLHILFTQKTHVVDKQFTIYRSHGTPMQNLAALKLLVATN